MLSPWRKHHLCCWLRCLCFHLCLLQRRMKCLFCLLHGGQETRRACWSKQNADACGVGKRDVDRRGANRWRDGGGITSSLPTRQPWVLLLCWIECNRPGFFSLTTGACEHTSSPPWERRLSWQSQCLCLCYFRLLSLPAPHLRLCLTRSSFLVLFVLAICFFFFGLFFPPLRSFSFGLIVYNTRWHYFHPLSEWNEKHLGDVQSRPAVKSFERSPPFRENPNWKPGAPEVTTNKLENAQARNEYRCDLIQKNLKQFP